MNKELYNELKSKYFSEPLYKNHVELKVIGFVAKSDSPIPELESRLDSPISDVEDLSFSAGEFFCYRVYAPSGCEDVNFWNRSEEGRK